MAVLQPSPFAYSVHGSLSSIVSGDVTDEDSPAPVTLSLNMTQKEHDEVVEVSKVANFETVDV